MEHREQNCVNAERGQESSVANHTACHRRLVTTLAIGSVRTMVTGFLALALAPLLCSARSLGCGAV